MHIIERRITVDAALTELLDISRRLDDLSADDPTRRKLEARREELQQAARMAADRARDPTVLQSELDHLHARLADIDNRPIGDAWSQKRNYVWINDPGAYSNVINRKIVEGDRPERDQVVRRIEELETVIQEAASDRSIENG